MSIYPVNKCPHCDNDEFYVKQRVSGLIQYNYKLNGDTNAYNGEITEGLSYKTISKYAYCNNCDKRLFKITEDMAV